MSRRHGTSSWTSNQCENRRMTRDDASDEDLTQSLASHASHGHRVDFIGSPRVISVTTRATASAASGWPSFRAASAIGWRLVCVVEQRLERRAELLGVLLRVLLVVDQDRRAGVGQHLRVGALVHVLVVRVGHQDRRHAAGRQLGATARAARLTARSATAQTSAIAGVKSITRGVDRPARDTRRAPPSAWSRPARCRICQPWSFTSLEHLEHGFVDRLRAERCAGDDERVQPRVEAEPRGGLVARREGADVGADRAAGDLELRAGARARRARPSARTGSRRPARTASGTGWPCRG